MKRKPEAAIPAMPASTEDEGVDAAPVGGAVGHQEVAAAAAAREYEQVVSFLQEQVMLRVVPPPPPGDEGGGAGSLEALWEAAWAGWMAAAAPLAVPTPAAILAGLPPPEPAAAAAARFEAVGAGPTVAVCEGFLSPAECDALIGHR